MNRRSQRDSAGAREVLWPDPTSQKFEGLSRLLESIKFLPTNSISLIYLHHRVEEVGRGYIIATFHTKPYSYSVQEKIVFI